MKTDFYHNKAVLCTHLILKKTTQLYGDNMVSNTWELGGNLDDVTVVCRNLFDLPKKRETRDGGQWGGT